MIKRTDKRVQHYCTNVGKQLNSGEGRGATFLSSGQKLFMTDFICLYILLQNSLSAMGVAFRDLPSLVSLWLSNDQPMIGSADNTTRCRSLLFFFSFVSKVMAAILSFQSLK